ncbi:unnamed protein product [Echinostoma caproni]|uniref:Proline dehydrogenase n=1 Tax=Echinostoma caproni TaxID=27848 RepID=A0A183AIK4_9TREM|nr:unnamed protein product [Echinostoma caproni]
MSFSALRQIARPGSLCLFRSPLLSTPRTISNCLLRNPSTPVFLVNSCGVRTTCRPSSSGIDESTIPDTVKKMTERLFQGDRRSLAQAITLLESTNLDRRREGQYILDRCMNYLGEQETATGKYTIRIGESVVGLPVCFCD